MQTKGLVFLDRLFWLARKGGIFGMVGGLEWRFVVESGEICVLGRWRVCVYGGCMARLLEFLGKLVFDVSYVV
jgi:hypothetical protein